MNDIKIGKRSNKLLKVLIIAALPLFFIALLNYFDSRVKNIFYAITSPVEKFFWSAGGSASKYLGSLLNAGRLAAENENLKNENYKLLSEIVSLQAAANVYQAESAAFLSAKTYGFNLVAAQIIGLDEQDMLSLDKGSDQGILEGMPVIDQQNILFGKIFKVYKNFSKIMLISNKNSAVSVKVGQTYGILRGKGKLNVFLDLVPIDEDLSRDDVLFTSALEDNFPKNLLVGAVGQVIKNDQDPYQQAEVDPFFDLTSTETLFVITDYKR
jgi:rod shape-determining protein MreC